jgi:hypothetical protein
MTILTIAHIATQPHLHPWQWVVLSALAVAALAVSVRALFRSR